MEKILFNSELEEVKIVAIEEASTQESVPERGYS